MKRLNYVLILLSMVCLGACFDIKEEIVIHDNGSGIYNSKMDMNKLLELVQNMMGEEALTKNGLDKPLDTSILLKNVMPLVHDTAVAKALWEKGTMDIHLNAPARILNTNTLVAFNEPSDLAQLMGSSGITPGINQVFNGIFGNGDSTKKSDSSSYPQMSQLSRVFDIIVTNGLISKRLNLEKYKKAIESAEGQAAQQMSHRYGEMAYVTIIRLPRPAKKINNPLLQLSNDKKTVTATFNLADLLDKPDKFSYTIEY